MASLNLSHVSIREITSATIDPLTNQVSLFFHLFDETKTHPHLIPTSQSLSNLSTLDLDVFNSDLGH